MGGPKDEGNPATSTLEASLRKHGEAFMSMFDDSGDEDEGVRADPEPGSPLPEDDQATCPEVADEPSSARRKKRREKRHLKDIEDVRVPGVGPTEPSARRQDDVDEIFSAVGPAWAATVGFGAGQNSKKGTTENNNKKKKKKNDVTKIETAKVDEERERQQREDERLRRKIERKRFMSSNADAMLSFDEDTKLAEAKQRLERSRASGLMDEKKTMDEFKAIRREIQSFGATGLDKKSRAKFEQDRLVELGARKQKGVRTSAKIGLGMAKKAAWREQRSIDEAIASGMVSRKAIAEKKRRALKKARNGEDRGLFEDGGMFNAKRGVLRIRK